MLLIARCNTNNPAVDDLQTSLYIRTTQLTEAYKANKRNRYTKSCSLVVYGDLTPLNGSVASPKRLAGGGSIPSLATISRLYKRPNKMWIPRG